LLVVGIVVGVVVHQRCGGWKGGGRCRGCFFSCFQLGATCVDRCQGCVMSTCGLYAYVVVAW
jgi:hypothetical protein